MIKNLQFNQSVLYPKYNVTQTVKFPIYEIDMSHRIDNTKVLELIYKDNFVYNPKPEKYNFVINDANDKNFGLYESNYDLRFKTEWQFLVSEITEVVTLVEKKLIHNRELKTTPQFLDLWYLIYSKSGGQVVHDHGWVTKWAMVYYVQANENDASVIFQNNDLEFKINPVPGKMLLFPGPCKHRVELHNNDSTRIAIVGNIGF